MDNLRYSIVDSKNKKKSNLMQDIVEEYETKRNNFNPKKNSPNMFTKKLKQRLKLYYNRCIVD